MGTAHAGWKNSTVPKLPCQGICTLMESVRALPSIVESRRVNFSASLTTEPPVESSPGVRADPESPGRARNTRLRTSGVGASANAYAAFCRIF